ncbi:PQQ-dependent sugar dehydrogenase [uncultured Sphingomonas sp.]|uniref:PQQ-dependent sugar dehydrogenase n=1 Tax=uncultured Sphingomonas sp. TaxID=158754 RepID=UPI00260255E8|nr:PQQ-dependent sugar dehydrogenase [uncultured Sphingomonas sp.]
MTPRRATPFILALLLLTGGCGDDDGNGSIAPVPSPTGTPTPTTPTPTTSVTRNAVATFDNPWAMVFLPDGRMLVTEKPGRLRIVTTTGTVSAAVSGVPAVAYAGQGGLQDVVLDPQFASNNRIYLSYAEAGSGGKGLAVARGTLVADGAGGRLDNVSVIWRQDPKVSGDGHFGGRMAFSSDRRLFVTAGERQKETPAQDLAQTLGKIVRIDPDGAVPSTNPFVGRSGAKPEIWTLGHRNPYGLVFAADGRLFESEQGPEGGDEFNLIEAGRNYGWPNVSEGNAYGGTPIPRHATNPTFIAPLVSWTPVIAPGGMIQYTGTRFAGWTNDFVLAGLVSQGLVRVRVTGTTASEVGRLALDARIREVEQGPDGTLWVLEDGARGRLVQLTPAG